MRTGGAKSVVQIAVMFVEMRGVGMTVHAAIGMRVFMTMFVGMFMRMGMVVIVGMIMRVIVGVAMLMALDLGFAFATAANGTHLQTPELIRS